MTTGICSPCSITQFWKYMYQSLSWGRCERNSKSPQEISQDVIEAAIDKLKSVFNDPNLLNQALTTHSCFFHLVCMYNFIYITSTIIILTNTRVIVENYTTTIITLRQIWLVYIPSKQEEEWKWNFKVLMILI